jgi:hypothetical protein
MDNKYWPVYYLLPMWPDRYWPRDLTTSTGVAAPEYRVYMKIVGAI